MFRSIISPKANIINKFPKIKNIQSSLCKKDFAPTDSIL